MEHHQEPSCGQAVGLSGSASIAHIDADAFFASVLTRTHPELQGKPLLAIGMGGGCVIAASYEAKAYGVRTGMRLIEARALVPGAIEMAADFRETGLASKQIESILQNACPVIEQMSIDEWYLDLGSLIGGAPADARAWGQEIQKKVLQNTALSVSVGIAATKILAKMAGEYHKPAGVTAIDTVDVRAFLMDRPAAAIPGIGRKRQIVTDEYGMRTAWDFSQSPDALISKLFGKIGLELKRELLGEQVYLMDATDRPPKSVSRCRSFRPTTDTSLLRAHVLKHLEYCVLKMRRWNLACTDLSVWLRTADYGGTGEHRRVSPGITVEALIEPATDCLAALTQPRQRWNQVGLALANFVPSASLQQSLFQDPERREDSERLQAALDTLSARFGRDAVTRGSALAVRTGTAKDFDLPVV